VRLDDLVDLYKRVFAHILSRADAKASPYSRYYIAVSTPHPWKHILTVFGAILAREGKLEDGTAQSVPISVIPPPYVRDKCVCYTTLRCRIGPCTHADCPYLVCSRASLFYGASHNVRGERGKNLGWEPRPVVLEDWADEGITSVLASLQK
jgi:hypothetical protein